VYDCDCNGFVGFVLKNTAPNHLAHIPKETNQPRPRAFEYFTFFASLTPDSAGDWKRIDLMQDANRGDIVAWRFPTLEAHANTGHVMMLKRRSATLPAISTRSASTIPRSKRISTTQGSRTETRRRKGRRAWVRGSSISKSTGPDGRSPISSRRRSRRNILTDRHRPRRLIDGDNRTL
jgi:hypothetical protein